MDISIPFSNTHQTIKYRRNQAIKKHREGYIRPFIGITNIIDANEGSCKRIGCLVVNFGLNISKPLIDLSDIIDRKVVVKCDSVTKGLV